MLGFKISIPILCALIGILDAYITQTPGQTIVLGSGCEPNTCKNKRCPKWETLGCEYGYTLDNCKCCYQCALYPGKMCGGSQNVYGTCGVGTYCRYKYTDDFDEERQSIGECTRVEGYYGGEQFVPLGVVVKPPSMPEDDIWGVDDDITTEEPEETTSKTPEKKPEGNYNRPITNWGQFGPETMPGDQPPRGIDERPDPSCKEVCKPELCEEDKRAICSATSRIYNGEEECENTCHHTSCLACDYVIDISYCGQCSPNDKDCLKKFGLCMKALKRKLKTEPLEYLNDGLKYACSIPDCKK